MTAAPSCGLYAGVVTHTRLRPRRHSLRYRIFMLLLDLDDLDGLDLRLLRHNRAGLLSFFDRDHLDGAPDGLRRSVEVLLAKASLDLEGGPIHLLCMPRMLGFVFNPISVYFCRHRSGSLAAILYEVNNTFGERHTYLIPVQGPAEGLIEQHCDKRLFVSPFMQMTMAYRFRVRAPGAQATMVIDGSDADGPLIATAFSGQRQPLSDRTLLAAVLAHPLMTLMVMVGIHWEALKIFLKGVGLRPRPPAPAEAVTVVR